MRRNLLLIIIPTLLVLNGISQNYFQPGDTNFLQVLNRNAGIPPDSSEDSPYIKFQRFASFWNERLYPDYNLGKVDNAYQIFYQGFNTTSSNPLATAATGNWVSLGPKVLIKGYAPWTGRLDHVEVDEDDATGNTIYVSSIGAGVFRTTDGGANWSNYFTDYAFGIT
jgi:hypothetical protein